VPVFFRVFLAFVIMAAMTAASAAAEEAPSHSGEVRLSADKLSHDRNKESIHAEGNVEVLWNGARLYADMATYLQGEGVVTATGQVRLLKDGDVLSGDSATLQVGPRTGMVRNGHLLVKKSNLHLKGAEIEKSGDEEYRLRQGSITSCDGDRPGWRFEVEDLQVSMNDFATGRNAYFYLGETPVFWMPYILFPVMTERQSGFFFPKFGNSSKKGAFLDIPYYWAISPSSDATFDLDMQSKRGVGLGAEYRYLSENRGHGHDRGYLIYDENRGEFRGDLALKQQVNFSADTYWRADVNLVTDRDFYRDYGVNSGEYNKQYLGTNAFLTRRLGSLLITGGAEYISDLEGGSNRATLQKLPYLSIMESGRRIGSTPFSISGESSLVHMEREVGGRGERLAVTPRIGYSWRMGEFVDGSLWGGYDQRLYHADETGGADGWHGGGGSLGGLSLRSELARAFDVQLAGMSRVRHAVAPEISYSFREKRDESGLPFFDYDDRPATGQVVRLSLLNLVTGKSLKGGEAEYRDLLRLNLVQEYQLSGERRDLLVPVEGGRPFADTRLKAELFPLADLRIFTDLRVSPYSGTLSNGTVGVDGGDPKGERLSLYWHHAKDRLDYLEGRLTYKGLSPFTLSAMGRYSFDKPGFLESLYSVEYRHQCWSLNLTYRERPDNNELSFSFTLSGLGVVGPLRAF